MGSSAELETLEPFVFTALPGHLLDYKALIKGRGAAYSPSTQGRQLSTAGSVSSQCTRRAAVVTVHGRTCGY